MCNTAREIFQCQVKPTELNDVFATSLACGLERGLRRLEPKSDLNSPFPIYLKI